jgi:hypothetical protein
VGGVVAVHVASQAVAAQGRHRVGRVVDQLLEGEVHEPPRIQGGLRPGEVPGVALGLPAVRRERHGDQGHQREEAEDEDQDDAPPVPTSPVLSSGTGEHG